MKKNKKLPIGEKVWFYNKETEKIETAYLWGVIYSKTSPNVSSGANEIHVSDYIVGEYLSRIQVPHYLCFFTWKEVLNFAVSKCELPLKGEKE